MELFSDKNWILISLVTVLVASCHASGIRRAVPNIPKISTENKGNDIDDFFKKFWMQHNGRICPIGQMPHRNNSVCCYVTVCGPGFEIEECLINGTEDKCSKCKENYLQKNNISSLNMEEAKCFPKVKDHGSCPQGDTRPSRNIMHKDFFPLPCECKLEVCYIVDDIGSCTKKEICKPGFQLNKTGSCEPCPWYSFKNVTGCEPCTINKTLLRHGKPGGVFVTQESRTTTVKAGVEDITSKGSPSLSTQQEEDIEPNKKSHEMELIYVLFLGFFTVVIVIMVVVMVYCCYNRRMRLLSVNAPPTPNADSAPLLVSQGIVTPNSDGTRFIPYQYSNHRPPGTQDNNNVHNMNYVRNGHAGNYVNGSLNRGHSTPEGMANTPEGMANGRLLNGAVANSFAERNMIGRVCEPPGDLDGYLDKQKSCKQKEGKTKVTCIQDSALDHVDRSGSAQRPDLAETYSFEGASGGEAMNMDDEDINSDNQQKVSKPLKEKGNDKISIHGNKFQNSTIIFGGKHVHRGNTGKKEERISPGHLTSISGTFEIDSSLNSTDFVSTDQTLIQPERGNGYQKKEEVDNEAWGHEVNKKYFCRPELGGSPGLSNQDGNFPRHEVIHSSVDEHPEGEKVEVKDVLVVNDVEELQNGGLPQNPERALAGVPVQPLQHSTPRDRPVLRVPPTVRQNSGDELRHVSGFPSRMSNGDSVSVDSMSYALMHVDSGLNNGFISRDVANITDFDIDQNNILTHPDVLMNERAGLITNGAQRQLNENEDEHEQGTEMQPTFNAQPLTRRDINLVGVTNSVPPMSQREGPEGNSITYSPENRPDLHETDRKIPVDVIDENETHEKQVGSNTTAAKTVHLDEDITKYKKKIKEPQNFEDEEDLKKHGNTNDLKKDIEGRSTEDSFELNSKDMGNEYNVENILYVDDRTADGEKSVNEVSENQSSERSFEINSKDIEKMETSKKASDENTKDDTVDSINTSQSYEINVIDFQKFEKANDEIDNVAESETSFEVCGNDLEQIETYKVSMMEGPNENKNNTLTCSGEASFEVNTSEIENLELNQVRDISEVNGASECVESREETNEIHGDSQYSPMTSSGDLSDTDTEKSA